MALPPPLLLPSSPLVARPCKTAGFVEREIKKEEIPVLNIGESVEAPAARELIEMESSFENIENDLKEVIASGDALRKTFLELTEMRHVLYKTQQFFDQVLSLSRETLSALIHE